MASLRIGSAQKGHFLYSPDSPLSTARRSDVDDDKTIRRPRIGAINAVKPAITPFPFVMFDAKTTKPKPIAHIPIR